MKYKNITHEFVDKIPDSLEDGKIYISMPFATALHKCFCGCGNEVVTPISPTDWSITYDGEAVSLDPSIGNWGFPCMSHYWIRNNEVHPAYRWSQERIKVARDTEELEKKEYFDSKNSVDEAKEKPFFDKLTKWFRL